jgi:hypothetical protein
MGRSNGVPWIIDSQEKLFSFLLSFVLAFLFPMSGPAAALRCSLWQGGKSEERKA